MRLAPVRRMLVEPVSDVIASVQDMHTPVASAVVPLTQLQSLIQDMHTPVAGAVVPLTQLQSLIQDMLTPVAGAVALTISRLIQDMLTPVAGAVVPAATAVRVLRLLVGHRRDGAAGRIGRPRRCWAVAGRGCVGGDAMAAGPTACRHRGWAVGRQHHRGWDARGRLRHPVSEYTVANGEYPIRMHHRGSLR